MSFLKLKRLLPPRKMWKVFTNKLGKFNKRYSRKYIGSKAIKKSNFQPGKISKRSARLAWPALSIYRPKKFKTKPKPRPNNMINFRDRKPDPIYYNQLYTVADPVSNKTEEACIKLETETVTMSDHEKSDIITVDEMWESSLVVSSPQTIGIDERAEEFIAKFRAQMRHQEILARRL